MMRQFRLVTDGDLFAIQERTRFFKFWRIVQPEKVYTFHELQRALAKIRHLRQKEQIT